MSKRLTDPYTALEGMFLAGWAMVVWTLVFHPEYWWLTVWGVAAIVLSTVEFIRYAKQERR